MTLSRLSLIALLTGSLSLSLGAQVVPEPAAGPLPASADPTAAVVPAVTAQQPEVAPAAPARPPATSTPAPPRGRGASVQLPESPQPPMPDIDERHVYQDVVRVGSSYALRAGTEAGDLVVVFGNATVDGYVHGDIAVILGDLTLGPQAVVDGEVVVVGGSATVAAGASANGEFVVVGGSMNAPPEFAPRGEHVIVGSPHLGSMFRTVSPWITRGLLWGRVLVPSLGWMWVLVGLSALVYLGIAVLFPGAVATVATTVARRPLTAFFAGLLTLLLVGPVSTVLAISVIGIIVIPFIFIAVLAGAWLGKAAVFEWIGARIIRPSDAESRGQLLMSVVIGMIVVLVLYMIPIVGLMTWAVIGMLGLGAAALTFFKAMRRERPARPPAAVVVPPAPAPAATGIEGAGGPAVGEPAPYATAATELPPSFAPPIAGASPVAGAGAAALGVGDLTTYPRATFLDRLAAGALDALLVIVAMRLFDIDGGGRFFLLLMLYAMAFWAWRGTTVGGIICSLRVVRTDGAALRPVDAVVRGLSSLFSFVALGIGFFWILLASNVERQAWHDLIAGTVVVRVPRNMPL